MLLPEHDLPLHTGESEGCRQASCHSYSWALAFGEMVHFLPTPTLPIQLQETRKLVHSSDKYRQKRAYERPDTEQSEEMHQDAEKGSPMSKDFIV